MRRFFEEFLRSLIKKNFVSGAITETYLSDLFPSEARAAGCSASTLASLLFRLVVLFSFPMLKVKKIIFRQK